MRGIARYLGSILEVGLGERVSGRVRGKRWGRGDGIEGGRRGEGEGVADAK